MRANKELGETDVTTNTTFGADKIRLFFGRFWLIEKPLLYRDLLLPNL
jgi:hypothetical protein